MIRRPPRSPLFPSTTLFRSSSASAPNAVEGPAVASHTTSTPQTIPPPQPAVITTLNAVAAPLSSRAEARRERHEVPRAQARRERHEAPRAGARRAAREGEREGGHEPPRGRGGKARHKAPRAEARRERHEVPRAEARRERH